MSRKTVALIGRPNVGKSTLFNRIVGGRSAIVHDQPGVTRDRHFGVAEWNGRTFWLVDTGGWVPDDDPISSGIREQVGQAVDEADILLFMVDTRDGVHPADQEVGELLRPLADRTIVVANKCDDLTNDLSWLDFHELGLGNPIPVSAATGKGTGDLLDTVVGMLEANGDSEPDESVINVAVVGKPNVGKSSITNRLLGLERSIVAPEAGTTRDAVDSPLRYHERTLNFIDTAGLRKRLKVKDDIEFYSNLRTERAIERADVCVLVVDATEGIHSQDQRIAAQAWSAGKGLIIAVNKWDLLEDKGTETAERGRKSAIKRAPFLRHAPFVFESATTGLRVRKILDLILEVADRRLFRIPTAQVNRAIEELVQRKQPPQKRGREVNILYASQVAVAPPTFAAVCNRPDDIPESYARYLINGFYDRWDFTGSPIRLRFRRKKGNR